MAITAVQHVRRMRGGAQGHLMRCNDGNFYVVKFQNNPQDVRVLANDLFASRLAEHIGLAVPRAEIVEVGPWLIEHTPELTIELAGRALRCVPGLQFGSRFVINPIEGQVLDYLPEPLLPNVRNLRDFAGALAFDKWTGNADGRQVVYWRRSRERWYKVSFIDQGYCFNAAEWTFVDSPLRGVHPHNSVYYDVTGWDSFEPWLGRLEQMDVAVIGELAGAVPAGWYGSNWVAMEALVAELTARRSRVRDLIVAFRNSSRQPFPNWKE